MCWQPVEHSIPNTKLQQSVSVTKAEYLVHTLKHANVTKIITLQFHLTFSISARRVLYPKAEQR